MDAKANAKTAPMEVGIHISDAKLAAFEPTSQEARRWDSAGAALRAACLASAVLSLCLMVTAEQHGELVIYGFHLPLYSKWTFSDSLEYLVGVAVAATAYSAALAAQSLRKVVKKKPVVGSLRHAWFLFAADQVLAYAMVSAGSAAAGVTNLNRTGIRHAALPDFCKPLQRFCDRLAISITFAFVACVLLALSTVLDVLWLKDYYRLAA